MTAERTLRFAHVTTFYPPYNFGGDGIVVQRFARALARRGHEVTVVHDVDTFQMLGGEVDAGAPPEDDGVRVVRVGGRFRTLSALLRHQLGRPVLTAGQMRRALEGPLDVVHFHNVSMVGGPGVLSYGGDAVRLYTAHEHWLVCPMHVLWRHDREPCDGRECLRCSLTYGRPPQLYRHSGYMERQLGHVDVFFAQSEFSRDKHLEFGFPLPMEILGPFLPLDDGAEVEQEEVPAATEGPFVLFAGRLERIKGLDDVLPVFRDDPPARLLVAGTGTHRPELERLAGDSPSIHFLGQVSNRAIQRLMRDAMAVLVPTLGFETFGFTVLEAFRAGTPVIARRRGPLPELVEGAGGGMVFERPEEVADAVRALEADPELRRRLGEAGRAAFRRRWSEDVVIDRYLEHVHAVRESRERTR